MKKNEQYKSSAAPKGEIVIYRAKDGRAALDVRLQKDNVWLSLNQISELFDRDKSVISRHLREIYKTGELRRGATVAKNATVQNEGPREVVRQVEYYNLDAIISIGYRVNSVRATQFRIWATGILRQHLLEGYTVNKELLAKNQEKFLALQKAVSLLSSLPGRRQLAQDEVASLLSLLSDYAYGLDLLDSYDRQSLKITNATKRKAVGINYREAVDIVERIRNDLKVTSNLFGKQKDESLKSSLAAINQTFDKKDLYPTIEEKAANLLYFVVKNHSFVDGNKRIAAVLFLVYLNRNGMLYSASGQKRLADSGLVALTLLIAESKPSEKNDIVKITVNLINRNNK